MVIGYPIIRHPNSVAQGIDHNSAPQTRRDTGVVPMKRALRELSNEFSKRFWGVLGAEL